MERLKKKRAAAARNQDIEIGEENQRGEFSSSYILIDNFTFFGFAIHWLLVEYVFYRVSLKVYVLPLIITF